LTERSKAEVRNDRKNLVQCRKLGLKMDTNLINPVIRTVVILFPFSLPASSRSLSSCTFRARNHSRKRIARNLRHATPNPLHKLSKAILHLGWMKSWSVVLVKRGERRACATTTERSSFGNCGCWCEIARIRENLGCKWSVTVSSWRSNR
jgi:hypothetical protein